jgi:hypothetical protein
VGVGSVAIGVLALVYTEERSKEREILALSILEVTVHIPPFYINRKIKEICKNYMKRFQNP